MTTMPPPPLATPSVSLSVLVYRYFFYRWLFRDATAGSPFERAAALLHNREQGRWLPLYMARWTVLGGALAAAQFGVERFTGASALAAALAIALILVGLYLFVTGLCWALLGWQARL